MLHVVNVIDENRIINPDEVSEFSIPGTYFDRQPHTHHMLTGQTTQTKKIPEFFMGAVYHHATHHHTNITTCQHKFHKSTTYHWLNKHQEIKSQMQTFFCLANALAGIAT